MRARFLVVASLLAACSSQQAPAIPQRRAVAPKPKAKLDDVGPRLVSNQTSTPLTLIGDGFAKGMEALVRPVDTRLPVAKFEQRLRLAVLDPHHAYVRLEPIALPPETTQIEFSVRLVQSAGDSAPQDATNITIVNDADFHDPTGLIVSGDGKKVFTLSPTEDALLAVSVPSGRVERVAVGDGPRAMTHFRDPNGREWIAVVHAFSPELRLLASEAPAAAQQRFIAPASATAVVIDPQRDFALVAEHARDTVVALDLAHAGREVWRTAVPPNPGVLALAEGKSGPVVAVGSLQTGEVTLLDRATGHALGTLSPGPGVPIIGGGTAAFSRYVMGGTAPRDLAWSPSLKRLFVASIGPNIGPNPDRMEVSMNSGVAVVDLATSHFVRHVGLGEGVLQALALDDKAGLLYAADSGLGELRVFDARLLSQNDRTAAKAKIQTLVLPPPPAFPTARPAADYGVHGRAGVELHSGPSALALSADRSTLYVLNRFTGMIATVDVAHRGKASLRSQVTLFDPPGMLVQKERRLGEILFFTDMGRTGMTCDACHVAGHTEGVLFTKAHPLRIYRSPTLLGSRDTSPYFIPESAYTLEQTSRTLGSRDRFHNPNLTEGEVQDLTLYGATLPTPPNPFVGPDGAPVDQLELPDGAHGDPRLGLAIFEGNAHCSSCHPGPLFTTDQSPATRGHYEKVGTPKHFPLRNFWQDDTPDAFPPPSLVGAWDIFPMLSSGTAGLGTDAGKLTVTTRFPLRAVLEAAANLHGTTTALSPEDKNDLLAYLESL